MEKYFALDKAPSPVLAAIFVFVVSSRRDALTLACEARLDRAGAMRLVAVQLNNMILDERYCGFRPAHGRAIKLQQRVPPPLRLELRVVDVEHAITREQIRDRLTLAM